MNSKAKKLVFAVLIALLALAAWQSILGDSMYVNIDGDQIDGPLGALLAIVFAGGGMLIAVVAVTCAAVLVGVLFAGLGILMVSALVLGAVVLLAAMSPLMLPLLIPVGIYWIFTHRSRKQRQRAMMEHAV
jgi:Na+-translocating ferredoxin:NAD+ oxidoreductase RnfD subunit